MSKGTKGQPYHMRWLPSEWLKVAALAYEGIQKDATLRPGDAIHSAQHAALPAHRWQDLARCTKLATQSWHRYSGIVGAMSPEARDAAIQADSGSPKDKRPPAPTVAMPAAQEATTPARRKPPHGYAGSHATKGDGSIVRWTSREWALIARAAKWVSERQPELPLYAQVIEAQRWTLPEDRQRAPGGITQSFYAKGKTLLASLLKAGLDRGWTINQVPFTPPGTEPAKPMGIMPELPSRHPEPEATPEAAPAAPPGAFAAPGRAIPVAPVYSTLTEAAKAFGDTLMVALDSLLHTHSQLMLAEVNARITATAADTGAQVAALIEGAMRRTVHQLVSAELGEVAPPAESKSLNGHGTEDADPHTRIDEVPEETAPDESGRRRLKIDVVGLPPEKVVQVRETAPGDIDLRFFGPDVKAGYVPHRGRHCIMLIGKIPHSLSRKIKAAGVEPIITKPTAYYVTHAIDEIVRAQAH